MHTQCVLDDVIIAWCLACKRMGKIGVPAKS